MESCSDLMHHAIDFHLFSNKVKCEHFDIRSILAQIQINLVPYLVHVTQGAVSTSGKQYGFKLSSVEVDLFVKS